MEYVVTLSMECLRGCRRVSICVVRVFSSFVERASDKLNFYISSIKICHVGDCSGPAI